MKRFLTAVFVGLITVSFLSACASPAGDKRGYGGKKGRSVEAKEEVVPAPQQVPASPSAPTPEKQ